MFRAFVTIYVGCIIVEQNKIKISNLFRVVDLEYANLIDSLQLRFCSTFTTLQVLLWISLTAHQIYKLVFFNHIWKDAECSPLSNDENCRPIAMSVKELFKNQSPFFVFEMDNSLSSSFAVLSSIWELFVNDNLRNENN